MTELPTTPFAEGALRGNDAPFQALVEHSASLIALLDRQGQILYQNPSAHQHLVGDPSSMGCQGRTILERLHPEDRSRIRQQMLHAPPGVTVTLLPFRMRHGDGRWRWLEGTAVNLLHDTQLRAILVHAHDVTARVLAEQRSLALEGLGTALASACTTSEVVQVILLQGLETMGAHAGGVLWLDADAQRVRVLGSAGYPESIERPWRSFPLTARLPAADVIREGRDLFLTREDWSALYPQLQHIRNPTTGSNALLPLKMSGRVSGAITLSFAADRAFSETQRQHLRMVVNHCALALERAELNTQLQRQERHSRKLTELSHDLVSIVGLDGTTRYVSPAVGRLLGYTPAERLGVDVFQGVHPEDRDQARQVFQQVITSGTAGLFTYRFQHRDGHWVWLESTGTDASDDPDLGGVVIATRNVTARIEAEQARRASEGRLQLFEAQSDTLIRIFSGEACLYASPAAETMLGYSPGELAALQLTQLVHPQDLPAVQAAWEARAPVPPYRMRHRAGRYLWVESTFRRVTNEMGTLVEVHVATRDITARRDAEETLRVQLRRFRHLVNLTAEFAAQEASGQHIQTALEHCIDLTAFTHGLYFPVDGDRLTAPMRAGQATDEVFSVTSLLEQAWRSEAIERALRRHAPSFAGPDEPVFSPPEALPRPVWTSLAVLPVVARGVLCGFMVFGTDARVEIDEDTRSLLLSVSEQASRAVERSVHLQELRESREETLRALGLALEYRDYETKGHTDRVVHLTERLGAALGFTGDDLDALRWGAFLHDTGKVAIPDAILLKPGKLTPEEWSVIRRHPGIGHEMLHHIPSLPPTTLEVVLYHQERWNGSGYPKGLAGTDIPLAARVFAVVDVYDALTSERPYKKAWTHAEASEQLRREAGTLLDARVVQAFLRLFEQADQPITLPVEAHHDGH